MKGIEGMLLAPVISSNCFHVSVAVYGNGWNICIVIGLLYIMYNYVIHIYEYCNWKIKILCISNIKIVWNYNFQQPSSNKNNRLVDKQIL